jgi:death-on-curing family protein
MLNEKFLLDLSKELEKLEFDLPGDNGVGAVRFSLNEDQLGKVIGIAHGFISYSNSKDIVELAAYMAAHISVNHILIDGNKRLSLVVTYVSLYLKGYELSFEKNYYASLIEDWVDKHGKTPVKDREPEMALFIKDIMCPEIRNSIISITDTVTFLERMGKFIGLEPFK